MMDELYKRIENRIQEIEKNNQKDILKSNVYIPINLIKTPYNRIGIKEPKIFLKEQIIKKLKE